jgi:hypothetical protein
MNTNESPFRDFSEPHSAHVDAIPVLYRHREAISQLANEISANVMPTSELVRGARRIHFGYALQALDEVTIAAQMTLTAGCYSVAEALSRIIFEQAINLMYIAEDQSKSRLTALLKHYITDARRRAKNWEGSSAHLKDELGVIGARKKIEYLDAIRAGNDWYKKAPGWPEARRRFFETGFEHQYHLLFSSASDSVHSLAQDVFNLVVAQSYPDDVRPHALKAFQVEKASFAIYLVINAYLFYAYAVLRVTGALKDSTSKDHLEEIARNLGAMSNEHDALTSRMYERM